MYTYNKNDKTYTFSSDELDIDSIIASGDDKDTNNPENQEDNEENEHKRPKKIEVINGGNDLDISPVSNYIEVEKPKNEKKENIVIPEDNK